MTVISKPKNPLKKRLKSNSENRPAERPSVDWVVFDIGNVLLYFSVEKVGRSMDRHLKGRGMDIARALWTPPLCVQLESGRITGKTFYRIVRKRWGMTLSYSRFCSIFSRIFTPNKPVIRLLGRLKSKTRLALLSNTNPIHWKHLRDRYPFMRRFPRRILSFEARALKPSPAIYRTALRTCPTTPERILFIDDKKENIRAARRQGWKAILYKTPRDLEKKLKSHRLI